MTDDLARFLPDDDEVLICASFSCPMCLRRAAWVVFAEDDDFGAARCRCMLCNIEWHVGLSEGQCLRLALAAPKDMLVLRGSESSASGAVFRQGLVEDSPAGP